MSRPCSEAGGGLETVLSWGTRVQTGSGAGRELTDDADWGKSRKDGGLSTGLRGHAFAGDLDQFQGRCWR